MEDYTNIQEMKKRVRYTLIFSILALIVSLAALFANKPQEEEEFSLESMNPEEIIYFYECYGSTKNYDFCAMKIEILREMEKEKSEVR